MIYKISYKKKFKKDLEKQERRGKDMSKMRNVLTLLISSKQLPVYFKNHKLIGNYKDRWECHIEPDWLLIYRLSDNEIIFERTGSHSDLFK